MGDFCRGERQTDTPCKESLGMNLFSVLWREKERKERRGKKRERQREGGQSRSTSLGERWKRELVGWRTQEILLASAKGEGLGVGRSCFLKGQGTQGTVQA